jgi:DNA segregation ATPase FtsK/SpoIIIE-like protein
MCRRMARIENAKPHDGVLDLSSLLVPDDDARGAVLELETELGDEFGDFRRAATLVVAEQYASAARLQRGLNVSYTRARRLLGELEEQHFVAPADGTRPRTVLVARDRLPDLERLLATA